MQERATQYLLLVQRAADAAALLQRLDLLQLLPHVPPQAERRRVLRRARLAPEGAACQIGTVASDAPQARAFRGRRRAAQELLLEVGPTTNGVLIRIIIAWRGRLAILNTNCWSR